jgi:hypothetical protein
MKTVFTNTQLAHVWAQQSQSYGKSRSMFFEGRDIFSYGRHYLAGRFYPEKGVILLNSNSYSITTVKHMLDIRRAVYDQKYFYTSDPSDPRKSLEESVGNIANKIMEMFFKLYPTENGFRWILSEISEHNQLCDIFKVKEQITLDPQLVQDIKDQIKFRDLIKSKNNSPEVLAKREALKNKKLELARVANLAKLNEDIIKFRNGETCTFGVRNLRPMILRAKGEVIETSGGAEVPVLAARLLLEKIKNGKKVEGLKVGEFTVTSFDGDRLKIGCHDIEIKEAMTVMAPFLNVGES